MLLDCHTTLGHYSVGDKKFTYKNSAIYEAMNTNQSVQWHFFDDVWQKFTDTKLHTLGRESLKSVYRRRAQQLRDEYDYLILHYSGGSDSHEILMTFLENNIKLDEILVQLALTAKEKVHTPNNIDKSASNILSEWDYAIKPVLDIVKQKYPNIKITISDYLNDYGKKFETLLTEDIYLNNYHFNTTLEMLRAHFATSDTLVIGNVKNKKVAEVIGIDKPLVFLKDNKFYMTFCDTFASIIHPVRYQKWGATPEPFYWSPKMPELCFEQAYVLLNYFETRPDLRHIYDSSLFSAMDSNYRHRKEISRKIFYQTIYHYFDSNTFQVDKPEPYSNHGASREKYFVNIPEFKPYLEKVDFYISSFVKAFKEKDFMSESKFKKQYFSKWFYIGEFSPIIQ